LKGAENDELHARLSKASGEYEDAAEEAADEVDQAVPDDVCDGAGYKKA